MSDLNLILTVATLCLVAVTWITDYFQWRSIRSVDKFLGGSRDVGQQFGDWLLEKEKLEDGTEVSNLESCASLVGRQIAGSFKMGLQGIQSGEARTIRSVESKLMSALEPEAAKTFKAVLERAGIPEELSSIAYKIAERNGWLDRILKNNGQGGISDGWQV